MTLALKRILYSGDKHSIFQGPYGSGKSILTRKNLHMFSNELQEIKKKKSKNILFALILKVHYSVN